MESCKKQKSSTHLIFFISENITFGNLRFYFINILKVIYNKEYNDRNTILVYNSMCK